MTKVTRGKAPVSAMTKVPKQSDPNATKTTQVAKSALSAQKAEVAERELQSRVRRETLCSFCKALYEKNGSELERDAPGFYKDL